MSKTESICYKMLQRDWGKSGWFFVLCFFSRDSYTVALGEVFVKAKAHGFRCETNGQFKACPWLKFGSVC